MKIAEFHLEHPALADTIAQAPEMTVEWKKADLVDGGVRAAFWVQGSGFDRFEDALAADRTASIVDVAGGGDRRLYRVDLTGAGLENSLYPLIVEEGVIVQRATSTAAGWDCCLAFPNQGSCARVFDFCTDRGIGYDIQRVYDDRHRTDGTGPRMGDIPAFGLTDCQRETLVAAVDVGYLDIPRENNLRDLGAHLGVSDTAASQRFRRGTETLIAETLDSA